MPASLSRSLFACSLIGLTAALAGCFQNTNYPAIPTSRGYAEDPNKPAAEAAMVAALQYVTSRWTPGQREFDVAAAPDALPMADYPLVINLPLGTRKMLYDRIARKVGPEVQPATPENTTGTLPVFHVTRVWLRTDHGIVDVLRPMPELGLATDGKPIYQKITVRLEGGFKPWNVVHARAWYPGDEPMPAFFYNPATDVPGQWYISQREQVQKDLAAFDAAMGVQQPAADTAVTGAPTQATAEEPQ
ncbi:MAG: hypothetical protein ACK5ZG_09075 [Phycisphaerae bacterium]|jgi:hypothetical protein